MSITGNLNVFPFSLTGLQNFDGTINGSTPVDSITISGQTTFLSASAVDVNGDVVLDLHIAYGNTINRGLAFDVELKDNVFFGTQDFSNSSIKMSLNTADTGFHVGYNPSTRALTYNYDASSDILGSNNIFTGTNQFSSNVLFTSGNINFTNLGTTSQPYFLAINPATGLITYNAVSTLSIFGTANTFTNTNYFTNQDIRFSGLVSSSDTSFLRSNDSTGQISKSLISSLLLPTANIYTNTNYFTNQDIRFSGLVSSSDTSFLRYNASTGAISSSLISSLLLPTANTFTNTNWFQNNTFFGNASAGRVAINMASGNAGAAFNKGCLNVRFENYSSGVVSNWTDNFVLFGQGDGLGYIYSQSPALGISQSSNTLNEITSLQPSSSYIDTMLRQRTLYIQASSLTYPCSTFSGSGQSWYGEQNTTGATLMYVVTWAATSLIWVIFGNNTGAVYGYYNTATQNFGTSSDERLKENIKAIDINKSKDFILNITPATYNFKDEKNNNIGFIAQDILKNAKTEAQKNIVSNWKIYEEAVSKGQEPYEEYTDASGNIQMRKAYLGLSQTSIIPELVGTIQAQNREIIDLQERLLKIEKLLDLK